MYLSSTKRAFKRHESVGATDEAKEARGCDEKTRDKVIEEIQNEEKVDAARRFLAVDEEIGREQKGDRWQRSAGGLARGML